MAEALGPRHATVVPRWGLKVPFMPSSVWRMGDDPRDACNGSARHQVPGLVTLDERAPLTGESLDVAVHDLAARDVVLGGIVERFGSPPLWDRPAGFPTLVHIILEQQVSLASAAAAFGRLQARLDPLTTTGFLGLSDADLLDIGFSRQKARYARALAAAVEDGTLDVDGLVALDDEAVDRELFAVPGIGPWTATIYRLMVLRRPDAWPASDIALAQSLAEAGGLERRPSPDELTVFAEAWRPWRAVAARILWHGYLETRAERRRMMAPNTRRRDVGRRRRAAGSLAVTPSSAAK